ncbi:MAG: efflux RND transporter periplasmic adaptor subunit [Pseudohongiella sp.]|nr:efflux RND transporter periplasmic adaptor subunit [Pseudohongiella sp.]MDO9519262.1 efflux RND transporter periplasmic adaptor subunit [Pseudohongiella sp.]MDP2128372.1 efflux RND transporter periplasmic adaptor subunit [Pseudohongiella sp.]
MKTRVLVAISAAAFLSATAIYQLLSGQVSVSASDSPEASISAMPSPTVTLVEVTEADFEAVERLPGRTHAYRLAEIRPQVSGLLLERLFEEGELVEQGQPLYQIDSSRYELDLQRAEANLMTAKANAELAGLNLSRVESLRQSDAISQYDVDQVQNALAQSQAALMTANAAKRDAELNIEYTRVYAPISGQISQSLITEGALVTANQAQPMAVITQLDPIYVDVMQSSADHMRMRSALANAGSLPVTLELADRSSYEQTGQLQFSSVFVSESTGSVQLRMLFPNPEHTLLPGLFVHTRLPISAQRGFLVPQQAAIRDNNGNLTVWKVQPDNSVRPVAIEVAREQGNQWLVTSGLQSGDRIVLEGFQRLAPGVVVNY